MGPSDLDSNGLLESSYSIKERDVAVDFSSARDNATNASSLYSPKFIEILPELMEHSCLHNFNSIACIRCGLLFSLAILTALLCILKLVKLHMSRHPSYHQFVIFYTAACQCLIGSVQWMFWNASQLDLLLQYMKMLQVLIMCHYYITLAIRALRKEKLVDRFLYPFLFCTVLYFTVISGLGIVNSQSPFFECLAPYWLLLSMAELLLVQVFCVSAFYITRRLNEISTLGSVRWAQKRDLWCIVVVFELSAFMTFMYDLVLQIMGNKETGCSAIFWYDQNVYSPIRISFMIVKLLLPIWAMLLVLQPAVPRVDREDVMPQHSDDATYGSIFSDDLAYRQLYQPTDSYGHLTPTVSPLGSPCMPDACMPYAFLNAALLRPNLHPIAEEKEEDMVVKKPKQQTKVAKSKDGTKTRKTGSTRQPRSVSKSDKDRMVPNFVTPDGLKGPANY